MKGIKETPGANANHPFKRLVIEAGRGDTHYWQDLWRYRELFYFLAWRDILVRYKQTVIGITWSVLRPVLTLVVFTVLFGKFAKFPSEGETPYSVMVFAAILPWQLFANALLKFQQFPDRQCSDDLKDLFSSTDCSQQHHDRRSG